LFFEILIRQPEEFCVDRRIVGEEIEYSKVLRVKDSEGKYVYREADDEFMRQIFKQIVEPEHPLQHVQDGFFMGNGGQIRLEPSGQHVEINTPECLTLRDIVAQDKATELTALRLTAAIKTKFNTDVVFHKKNSDFQSIFSIEDRIVLTAGNTRGCHENYCVESELISEIQTAYQKTINPSSFPGYEQLSLRHLLLFMETRQILSGGGGLKRLARKNGQSEIIYCVSPRALHTHLNFGRSTTVDETRGIINAGRANEALADPHRFGRLHIDSGDANMAEVSTFLKFGTTSAVLEMIENKCWDETLLGEDPDYNASLFRAISRDLTCRSIPIRLTNGDIYGAIDIQKLFAKRWKEYVKTLGFPEEKARLSELWLEALRCLETDDPKAGRLLDWKIKLQFFKKYCKKKSLPIEHERIATLDLEYHNPDLQNGIYNRLKNRGLVERLIYDRDIENAILIPPQNTRARLRRHLFDIFTALDVKFSVRWDFIGFKSERFSEFEFQSTTPIDLLDPFVYSVESLDITKKEKIIVELLETVKRKHDETRVGGSDHGGAEAG